MIDDTPKLPAKVTIYIRKENRAAYRELVSTSERSASEIFNDALFSNGRHDKEQKILSAKQMWEVAEIKKIMVSRGLMNEDIEAEIKLFRTFMMKIMGRRT